MANGAVPLLVSVVVCAALALPTTRELKVRLAGVRVIPETVPVPLARMPCGLFAASSTTETMPVRLPAAVGAKVTEIVQVASGASVAGQSFV